MLLIQRPPEPPKREQIKITVEEEIYKEISAYCSKAGITIDHFIEQAASFIFRKDKKWREWKKQQANNNLAK